MKTRVIAVSALALVVVLLLWNLFFYSPAGKDVSKANQRVTTAQSAHSTLLAEHQRLLQSQQNGTKIQAQLSKLEAAIPATPDLQGFLNAAYDVKLKSGVDWVSIAPSEPSAGAGPSEIKMQIVVRGGFFQVLDYLNQFEDPAYMPRLVIIDGINIASSTNTSTGSSSTPTTTASGSAPNLSVTLTARMFTQATPTTGTGVPGGSTVTTPTTAATSGSTPTTSAGVSN